MSSTRHRWDDKKRHAHKTEQQCQRCGIVKATHHQFEGGREIYWTEFWRDLEKIETDRTPLCDARLERDLEKMGKAS